MKMKEKGEDIVMGSFAVLGKAPYVLKAHEKKEIRNSVPERERAA